MAAPFHHQYSAEVMADLVLIQASIIIYKFIFYLLLKSVFSIEIDFHVTQLS